MNITVQTTVHLLPSRLGNIKDGVQSLLSSLLMKYHPQLDGVVLAYDKLKILTDNASIFNERPHLHFDIQVRLLIFRPQIGAYVIGVVNKVAPDHVGVLIHGIFNATVNASSGLSQDFEYNPTEDTWVNETLNKEIRLGTRLRLQINKLSHTRQILSFECSMLDDNTGICE